MPVRNSLFPGPGLRSIRSNRAAPSAEDPPRDGEATHHSQGPCRRGQKGSRENGRQGRGAVRGIGALPRARPRPCSDPLTVLGADRLPSAAVPRTLTKDPPILAAGRTSNFPHTAGNQRLMVPRRAVATAAATA